MLEETFKVVANARDANFQESQQKKIQLNSCHGGFSSRSKKNH